jgi:hypothetical protein
LPQVFLDEAIVMLIPSDDVRPKRDISLENATLEQTAELTEDAPKQPKPAARAKRSAEQLRFQLKEAMAQRGGSDAFLHWLSKDGAKHA